MTDDEIDGVRLVEAPRQVYENFRLPNTRADEARFNRAPDPRLCNIRATFRTDARFRLADLRSSTVSRTGIPVTSSTLTSAAPRIPARMLAIWLAARRIGSNSSPNTLMARSSFTPAISSLKRI